MNLHKWDLRWGPYTAEVECNDSIVEYRNDFKFCPFCGRKIEESE